jgi:hypothetical protein
VFAGVGLIEWFFIVLIIAALTVVARRMLSWTRHRGGRS